MAQRCAPPGHDPSRVIALWKDPHHGLQQIPVADDAQAVAITAHARQARPFMADGRQSPGPASELVLSGIEQIC